MTITEYKSALEALDDKGFDSFRKMFGGDFATRQQYVDEFVHKPDHERRICQLLGLMSQEEKLSEASMTSARAALEAARSARWSMIWALVSVFIAMGSLFLAASK